MALSYVSHRSLLEQHQQVFHQYLDDSPRSTTTDVIKKVGHIVLWEVLKDWCIKYGYKPKKIMYSGIPRNLYPNLAFIECYGIGITKL